MAARSCPVVTTCGTRAPPAPVSTSIEQELSGLPRSPAHGVAGRRDRASFRGLRGYHAPSRGRSSVGRALASQGQVSWVRVPSFHFPAFMRKPASQADFGARPSPALFSAQARYKTRQALATTGAFGARPAHGRAGLDGAVRERPALRRRRPPAARPSHHRPQHRQKGMRSDPSSVPSASAPCGGRRGRAPRKRPPGKARPGRVRAPEPTADRHRDSRRQNGVPCSTSGAGAPLAPVPARAPAAFKIRLGRLALPVLVRLPQGQVARQRPPRSYHRPHDRDLQSARPRYSGLLVCRAVCELSDEAARALASPQSLLRRRIRGDAATARPGRCASRGARPQCWGRRCHQPSRRGSRVARS